MTSKTETKTISLECELPHPPAKVWRALTEPALLAAWFMSNDMKPTVGHSFTFQKEPMPGWDGKVYCQVLEADAPKRLRYSWRKGGVESSEMRLDTVVTFTLTPTPKGTRLVLEHSGFLPANASAFNGIGSGWKHLFEKALPDVLARTA
jgi:uncharacterized protein YndB with AHSA1/START domain